MRGFGVMLLLIAGLGAFTQAPTPVEAIADVQPLARQEYVEAEIDKLRQTIATLTATIERLEACQCQCPDDCSCGCHDEETTDGLNVTKRDQTAGDAQGIKERITAYEGKPLYRDGSSQGLFNHLVKSHGQDPADLEGMSRLDMAKLHAILEPESLEASTDKTPPTNVATRQSSRFRYTKRSKSSRKRQSCSSGQCRVKR